jgi:hypothetical protein
MTTHQVRIPDESMIDISTGKKSFIVTDDCGFDEGDLVLIEGYNEAEARNTEKLIEAEITHIELGNNYESGIQEGFAALGLKVRNYNF